MSDKFEGYFARTDQYPGIAFYVRGPVKVWEPYMTTYIDDDGNEYEAPCNSGDGEWVNGDGSQLRAVMVADDREHIFDAEDLTRIDENEFCFDCGQLGCGHGRY